MCGNGPKREPRSPPIPLVFLGDRPGLWRPARCQQAEDAFLFACEPCLVGASVHGGETARVTAVRKTEVNRASAWLSQCQGQTVKAELLAWLRVWLPRHTCYAQCARPV